MKRRDFLISSVSTIAITSLAGCTGGNSLDEYPKGLSKESITDVNALFNKDSSYLNSKSVTIKFVNESLGGVSEITSKVDSANSVFYIKSVRQPESSNPVIVEQYFEEGVSYYKSYNKGIESDSSYKKEKMSFNKTNEYYVDYLLSILQGITFTHEKVEDGVIVYTSEDIGGENRFSDLSNSSVLASFDFDGKPKKIQVDLDRSTDDEDTSNKEFTFSSYNNTTVSKPEWVAEEF